jgi:hypothetical protein
VLFYDLGDVDDMRISLATAGSAVLTAAMLSGCSNAPPSQQTLPAAASLAPAALAPTHAGKRPHYLHPNARIGPISAMRLLELQAAGKLPAPAPAGTMRHVLAELRAHPKRLDLHHLPHDTSAVAIWAVNGDSSYLVGQKKGGKKTETAIDLQADNCVDPQSVHVDHSKNVWVGCEYDSDYSLGNVLEFSSSGTLQGSYTPSCPSPVSSCSYWYSYAYDAATDGTKVYAAIPFSEEQICNPNCSYVYGSGFEYWPAGNASATPTYINVGEACSPVCDTDYVDLDSSGNIWFSYYGCTSSCGGGLAEVTNPTTNPKFVPILDPSTFQCPGGVYVSNGGKILNYVDACQRTISQYTMPVTSSSQPEKTLGPTPMNVLGAGQPIGLGFNAHDKAIAAGDSAGWLDLGTTATNKWKAVPSINLGDYVPGAAYTPSDK